MKDSLLKVAEPPHIVKKIKKNLNAIYGIQPSIVSILQDKIPSNLVKVEHPLNSKDALLQNLKVGESLYYEKSAKDTLNKHLKNWNDYCYLMKPVGITGASSKNRATNLQKDDSIISDLEILGKKLGASKIDEERMDGSLIINLGLGLGHHIVPMAEKLRPSNIFIIEPDIDLWLLSLRNLDWSQIAKDLEKLNCSLKLFISANQKVSQIVSLCMSSAVYNSNIRYYSKVAVYNHDNKAINHSVKDGFADQASIFFTQNGFIEDERVMMVNGLNSLSRAKNYVFVNKQRYFKRCPAVLVASGPSVEKQYETIKKLSKHAIIFSCGTGLSGLLAHGITPDFHSDLENGVQVFKHLKFVSKKYGLKGVTLLGSTTLNPGCAKLFDKAFLHHRSGPSVYNLTSDYVDAIDHCEPSVANTALSQAAALGFTSAYLFGIDLGSRSKNKHHANSIDFYNEDELFGEQKRKKEVDESQYVYDKELRANFGGVAYSNSLLNFFSANLSFLCVYSPSLVVYNASDGCFIEETKPILPESIDLELEAYKNGILTQKAAEKAKDLDKKDIESMFRKADFLADHIDGWWARPQEVNKFICDRIISIIDEKWPANTSKNLYKNLLDLSNELGSFSSYQYSDIPKDKKFLLVSWRGTLIYLIRTLWVFVEEFDFATNPKLAKEVWLEAKEVFKKNIYNAQEFLNDLDKERVNF